MGIAKIRSLFGRFHPCERFMLTVTFAAAMVDLAMIGWKGSSVDWLAYAGLLTLFACLLAGGLAYRITNRSERIALSMIGAGIFIMFSAALSMYNYLLLPLTRPVIDVPLAEMDAMFGYHWPQIMQWAADHLFVSNVLKMAYITTLPQIALLVVILGLTGRQMELHKLLVSVTISATITICFWGLFPTLGAKSMYQIPMEIWQTVAPIVNLEYTNELKKIAVDGPGIITPSEIRGLIAFPSYHAVLAFTAIYAARTVKWLFPIFLVVNLLILPGIFVHGGHHLVDLPAGFVVFLIGAWAGNHVVHKDYRVRKAPALCPA